MNKLPPVISIIVPVFNQKKYIGRCLRSILSQSIAKKKFETIVVNDGSTDKTSLALQKFKKNVKIISNKKNQGLPKALNNGIKKSKGRFIIRIDSDDYVNKDFLLLLLKFLRLNKHIDAVACDYYLVDDKEKIIQRVNCIRYPIACGILIKTRNLVDIGLYDEDFLINEEKDLRIRFLKKYTIGRVEKPLYRYRQHKNSLTTNKIKKKSYDIKLKKKYAKK